jgi:hypothetical protein
MISLLISQKGEPRLMRSFRKWAEIIQKRRLGNNMLIIYISHKNALFYTAISFKNKKTLKGL